MWGYYREILDYEREFGAWFTHGPGRVVWYSWSHRTGEPMPEELCLHLAIREDWQKRYAPREFLTGMHVIPQILGAHRLWCETRPEVGRYLERLGWSRADEGEWIIELGVRDGTRGGSSDLRSDLGDFGHAREEGAGRIHAEVPEDPGLRGRGAGERGSGGGEAGAGAAPRSVRQGFYDPHRTPGTRG